MKKFITFLILFLMLTVRPAWAEWEAIKNVTYFGTTDEQISVAWNASADATEFDLQLYHVEQKRNLAIATTPNKEMILTIPRTGHYIIKVRAKKPDPDNTDEWITSIWAESDDSKYGMVDGQPQGWWVYGYPAPVGGLILN